MDVKAAREKAAAGDAVVIDVRSEEEWQEAHIPGSVNLPEGKGELDDVDEDKTLLVIGADSGGADEAKKALEESGHEVETVEGGMDSWAGDDLPMQPSGDADAPLEDPPDEPLEERIPSG
jgi:rhodanese-related sulfurtransferase